MESCLQAVLLVSSLALIKDSSHADQKQPLKQFIQIQDIDF